LKSITINRSTYEQIFQENKNSGNEFNLHISTSAETNEDLILDLKHLLAFLGFKGEEALIDPVTLCVISDPVSINEKPPYYDYDTIFTILKSQGEQGSDGKYVITDPLTREKHYIDAYMRNSAMHDKIHGFAGKCGKFGKVMHYMKK